MEEKMNKVTIGGIIKTSIVTAFTIATALIWKDVIMDSIHKFFPAKDLLFYEFLVAVFATIAVVILLYLILRAEDETEIVMRKWKDKKAGEEAKKIRKKLKEERKRKRKS